MGEWVAWAEGLTGRWFGRREKANAETQRAPRFAEKRAGVAKCARRRLRTAEKWAALGGGWYTRV